MDQKKQFHIVQLWLNTSMEYLSNCETLYFANLDKGNSSISRPTILLFCYFLENVLKSSILLHENLESFEKFAHLDFELFERARIKIVTDREKVLVEFLNESIRWGKYPERKTGDLGESIGMNREGKLSLYHNQTFFYADILNFKELIFFSKQILNSITKYIQEQNYNSKDINFLTTLKILLNHLENILKSLNKSIIGSSNQ